MQDLLEAVKDLGPHAQRLAEGRGAEGHDHEFLEVDVVVGVLAAVEDVHHRHGQVLGVGAAEVAVERQTSTESAAAWADGQRDAQDGVGAELGLVRGAVEFEQELVDGRLLRDVLAHEFGSDDLVDVADGLQHAAAQVAFLVAVAQLDGFVGAGAGAAGDGGPTPRVRGQKDVDFERRVATAVQDFAGVDIGNPCAALRWQR